MTEDVLPSVEPVFDEVIHAPRRLQICAVLAPVASMDLAVVRNTLGIGGTALEAEVRVLLASGYLTLGRPRSTARTSRWIGLTTAGRTALDGHLAELRRIAAVAHPSAGPADRAPRRGRS